jgi:hypothetical protein
MRLKGFKTWYAALPRECFSIHLRCTPVHMVEDILLFTLPLPLGAFGIFQMTKELQY